MPKIKQKRYYWDMYKVRKASRAGESGAVAIFTVIFFLLLVSVITLGFVRIMLQEQSQAVDNDLSQSALNSAQAGVEDAKRVVKWYTNNCPGNAACTAYEAALNSTSCNAIYGSMTIKNKVPGFTVVGDGVQVSSDPEFNQVYTCLTISMNSPKLAGNLSEGKSEIIPLRATGAFNRVKIRWYSTKDTGGVNVTVNTLPLTTPLLARTSWPSSKPPIMRTQLISHPENSTGTFAQQDVTSKTRFLYPFESLATTQDRFSSDVGGENTQLSPTLTSCSDVPRGGEYYCEADMYLNLLSGVYNGGAMNYLRLNTIYKNSDYQIELFNGLTPVNFMGVQPIVDVTGRANDVFRRVQVGIRADVGDYPENALESAQQICKKFSVTNNPADFNELNCAPPAP